MGEVVQIIVSHPGMEEARQTLVLVQVHLHWEFLEVLGEGGGQDWLNLRLLFVLQEEQGH